MIVLIDYGVGNLFSLKNAFDYLGIETCLSNDPAVITRADAVILPGVGAFGDAMQQLRDHQLIACLDEAVSSKKPLLGICLGMQLLYKTSYEYGEWPGLGYFDGSIVGLQGIISDTLKVPHMGWNKLEIQKDSPLFAGIEEHDEVYFVHSYAARPKNQEVLASADYGIAVPAVVQRGNIYGMQFHPEKSGRVGLQLLQNFVKEVSR